jgi:hypothetical protein
VLFILGGKLITILDQMVGVVRTGWSVYHKQALLSLVISTSIRTHARARAHQAAVWKLPLKHVVVLAAQPQPDSNATVLFPHARMDAGGEHQVRIFVMIVIVSAGMTLFLADAGVVASQAVV